MRVTCYSRFCSCSCCCSTLRSPSTSFLPITSGNFLLYIFFITFFFFIDINSGFDIFPSYLPFSLFPNLPFYFLNFPPSPRHNIESIQLLKSKNFTKKQKIVIIITFHHSLTTILVTKKNPSGHLWNYTSNQTKKTKWRRFRFHDPLIIIHV